MQNDQANINNKELIALKKLALEMLSYDEPQIEQAIATGTLIQVKDE